MKYLLRFVEILRCVIWLGPWQAFKLISLAPQMKRQFSIRMRGLAAPIVIRGKTSDAWVFNEVLLCRQYSGIVIEPPARILDGGANIGLSSLYWSQAFPGAEIVAVEPDKDNFGLLEMNTRHLPNVTRICGALWSRKASLTLLHPDAEKYAVRVVEDEDGPIEAHSIDSIMQQLGWDWIDVIKLDVEGSETQILSAEDKQWIDKFGTLIIELHQDFAPESARVLFHAFAEKDFHLSWRGENLVLRRLKAKAA